MEFVLLLTGCVVFPFLHCSSLYFVSRIIPGRPKGLYYAISTRLVSFLQAVCASCVGLQVILKCNNVMKDRFSSVNYYAWFGFSYFYYDLGAMFLESYHSFPNDSLITNCHRLLAKKWLIVLHHIFLPIFGFPMIVFYRRGLGDFFVGCIYLAEMSTPFLSVHAILRKLDMQKHIIFKVNGFLLAISFFIGRIFVFPFMYYSYAKHSDLYIWQVPFKIPLLCNISCFGLLTVQLVWFITIVRQVVAFMKTFMTSYKDEDSVHHQTRSFSKNNNSQTLNSTLLSNDKER
ncbi:FAM57A [Paramuricea clavata]|uniref:FAM57A n=1 Tax=Paramuricea clavata TaxID=317549 RepID=A0A7D9DXU8_PARCT|nr:FAM57A [Paramuricea clavata]